MTSACRFPSQSSHVPGLTPSGGTAAGRRCVHQSWRPAGRGRSSHVGPTSSLKLTARTGRRTPAVADCIGSLYAFAYLTSGNPQLAECAVISAFARVFEDPSLRAGCWQRRWMALVDQVDMASEQPGAPPPSDSAPFRHRTLSRRQREAIALHLSGHSDREAARLLGGSLDRFYRHLHGGLTLLVDEDALAVLGEATPDNLQHARREARNGL